MSKAGEEILAGINDAIAMAKGDKSRGRAYTIINSTIDVKAIRQKTGMTQERFADTYGLSLVHFEKMGIENR